MTCVFLRWSALLSTFLLAGCSAMGYYANSVRGHWEIVRKAESIDDLLADERVAERTRSRLRRAQQMRRYASEVLALPDNDSYTEYADLGRPYVVWSVTAAPTYSLEPKRWCFAFVGCLSYRGYFSEQEAQQYASTLQQQGWETSVRGTAAYSTLGWFDDPLLNTMMHWSDARLAGLIFHELAHQVVYLKGDTAFNEGFAVAVQEAGMARWLLALASAEEAAAYQQAEARQQAFNALLKAARADLESLYNSGRSEAELRDLKRDAYRQLQSDYQRLKAQWGGYAGYDAWMAEVNNARLALFSTYHEHAESFHRILDAEGGDFSNFYAAVKRLSQLAPEQRRACLTDYASCQRPSAAPAH